MPSYATAAGRGEPVPAPHWSGRVGSRTGRYQGRELALGMKPYVNDLREPGMLHGAIRWSDHPRAKVRRIDASRARAHPEVVAVAAWPAAPGERRQGLITKDWRQFVAEGETTNYVGDVLAVVAATSRAAAREAAALIEVEYQVLEPVTDPFTALAPGAPEIHEGGNILSVSKVKRGDVDAALANAAHVATETFQTQFVEHAFLEPEAALAVPTEDGGVHVHSQGQGPWDDRRQGASFLALPEEKVRGTQVSNGGGLRGEGGPERPGPCRAAYPHDRPAGAANPVAPGEHPLPHQAPPPDDDLHGGLRRRGPPGRGTGAHRVGHRSVCERRRQGAGARGGARLRALQGAQRRRGVDGGLHQQPPGRRHARVRRQPGQLRHGRDAGHPGQEGGHRRLGERLGEGLGERD